MCSCGNIQLGSWAGSPFARSGLGPVEHFHIMNIGCWNAKILSPAMGRVNRPSASLRLHACPIVVLTYVERGRKACPMWKARSTWCPSNWQDVLPGRAVVGHPSQRKFHMLGPQFGQPKRAKLEDKSAFDQMAPVGAGCRFFRPPVHRGPPDTAATAPQSDPHRQSGYRILSTPEPCDRPRRRWPRGCVFGSVSQ
jgi:hypothetical protein